jgi:predicted flap endonuclease-1-like 5' DNA nuclease
MQQNRLWGGISNWRETMGTIIQSYNEDTIRALAHQRWVEEGHPDGRAEIHWQWALASLADTAERPATPAAKPAVKTTAKVADDVSLIDGIGPKIKADLAKAGIKTLAQLAALSPEAMAKLDTKLGFKGRSARDEWIAQAGELVAGKAPRAKTDKVRAASAR